MKKTMLFLLLIIFFTACAEQETPYFTHLYGRLRLQNTDSTFIDGVLLQISDLNPDHLDRLRIREVTTATSNSLKGYFELDSVCFATSAIGSSEIVSIYCDSINNPAFPSQLWYPEIHGRNGVDSIIINIHY